MGDGMQHPREPDMAPDLESGARISEPGELLPAMPSRRTPQHALQVLPRADDRLRDLRLTQSVELVVARYAENLDWLHEMAHHLAIIVYNKGVFGEYLCLPPRSRCAWLRNDGREAGTFLHHIVERYHYLHDWTVFLQGNPSEHTDDLPQYLDDLTSPEWDHIDVASLARWHTVDDERGRPNHWRYSGAGNLPIKEIYEYAFRRQSPTSFAFGAGAQYAVRREVIHTRPLAWWRSLKAYCETEHAETFPWALERMWICLFCDPLEV